MKNILFLLISLQISCLAMQKSPIEELDEFAYLLYKGPTDLQCPMTPECSSILVPKKNLDTLKTKLDEFTQQIIAHQDIFADAMSLFIEEDISEQSWAKDVDLNKIKMRLKKLQWRNADLINGKKEMQLQCANSHHDNIYDLDYLASLINQEKCNLKQQLTTRLSLYMVKLNKLNEESKAVREKVNALKPKSNEDPDIK
jgi:hypothetical protein